MFLEGVCLGGGRYFTSTPLTDGISLTQQHNWDIVFKYFNQDTLNYVIHQFYYNPDGDEETMAHNTFKECILYFESENEKEEFKQYVLNSWKNKIEYEKDVWVPHFLKIDGYIMEKFERQYKDAQILKRLFISIETRT